LRKKKKSARHQNFGDLKEEEVELKKRKGKKKWMSP
jgi:hypothetical protein